MFQFPGFALKTLCIQVISTWFCLLLIDLAADNNKQSSGLPHSEIHGSKLILSSSWLIAEYHVLHRLLLPRHSPNALLALDLIQKEQNRSHNEALPLRYLRACISPIKSHFFPASGRPETFTILQPIEGCQIVVTVSCRNSDGLVYLTWTTHVRFKGDMILRPARPKNHLRFRRTRPSEITAHSQQPNMVDFVSL